MISQHEYPGKFTEEITASPLAERVNRDGGRAESGRQAAAEKYAQRWVAGGRDVIRLIPHSPAEDFADLVEVSK